MKRTITILAVLLVATALFAGVTVKAGGSFEFSNMVNAAKEGEVLFHEEQKMKSSGLGFEAGIQVDLPNNAAVYSEVYMTFPKDAEFYVGSDVKYKVSKLVDTLYGDKGSYKIRFYGVSAGLAFRLDFDAVRLLAGCGVMVNSQTVAIHVDDADNDLKFDSKLTYFNIGLNALVDAKYMISENAGVGITLNPQIGLYNFAKTVKTDHLDPDENLDGSAKGFKLSYAMPITIGVSYTF